MTGRGSLTMLLAGITACAVAGCAPSAGRHTDDVGPPLVTRVQQSSGTSALLQAVSVVSERIVWVSGHRGTYVRTTDGGLTWRAGVVPGADTLQFRDVYAVDSVTAYLMSAGSGDLSRIYKTTDGGTTWTLQFTNDLPEAFYDCMDFWDADHGIAFSDAVDGQMVIIATENGGASWTRIATPTLPAALPGEGAFAASGTCLVTRAPSHAWIGMGNTTSARVLHTADRGRSWTVSTTPLVSGEGTGITSVAFRDARAGVVMGGALGAPDEHSDNVAVTTDGGRTWRLAGRPRITGAIYGGAYVPGARVPTLVAVGPKGADYSVNDGATWTPLDTLAYWAVGFASPGAGWAVGPGGRITKFALAPR
ncbi:MAG TPA: hypothetical protein VJ803_11165 [Gemmatimonadaceae bacterium]|nr:hypothetical protein [Gemmatimonadaceae bacterium]